MVSLQKLDPDHGTSTAGMQYEVSSIKSSGEEDGTVRGDLDQGDTATENRGQNHRHTGSPHQLLLAAAMQDYTSLS